ncbi:MAG TPA: hypothetical protein H9814_10150 [Candidatus Bacteroides merdigallinarum]|uniref:Lipoprotein n=1 Tax=Candidatus Bacteroides merdigallinarum TaxID=2838473 RepID=A0A9D2J1V0_9BACE|nr:hypothetical protein [Candidatus Bacteroides merdigallinarum]
MKKPILFLTALCCLLTACEDVEKKANEKLQLARQAYEAGQYNEAKEQIDSIKILYPKAFDARRAGIYLMQDIELAEQQKTVAYLDSLLQVQQADLEKQRARFVLEKDTAYQQIGHYLAPAQVIEKNLHRSYLRFQTDETGVMSLTSIYCGKSPIHHTAVKVTAPDGTFAQTPASKDSYETSDLGEKIEKADYKLGEDGGVILFVGQHKDQNLRVTFTGDRTYSTTLSRADRQAAADVYQLSQLLSSITQLKKDKEEALMKIRFVQENIKKRKTETEE